MLVAGCTIRRVWSGNLGRCVAHSHQCGIATRVWRASAKSRVRLGAVAAAAFAAAAQVALDAPLRASEAQASGSLASILQDVAARLEAIEKTLSLADDDDAADGAETIVNWSATHTVETKKLHQPESIAELEALVASAHASGRKLRVLGSAISPNGIGFSTDEMVTLSLCDKVLSVDRERAQVTVEAGTRVQQVVEALREHELTLQNYASIAEQQIGGFISVGAHGTGAQLPTVDDTVVRMKLITPSRGTIEVSRTQEPELFALAKVGLGALGVVCEVTLQCVPAHELLEHTFVRNRDWVKKHHCQTLQQNKHVRYMWVPYTDTVVIVTNNPISDQPTPSVATFSNEERLAPFRALLEEVQPETPAEELATMSFADYRDKLISHAPLNKQHIVRINRAEAEFWKRSEGYARGPSDTKLQFECGGQQWVSEVGFPCGSFDKPDGGDLSYMDRLLALIEEEGIAAPSPIEQRWTSGSSSKMSVAAAAADTALFSWVGIIMYLPTEDPKERKGITDAFFDYRHACEDALWGEYGAVEHWAKVEAMHDDARTAKLRERLAARFPVAEFNAARRALDPKNILANNIVDALFPLQA